MQIGPCALCIELGRVQDTSLRSLCVEVCFPERLSSFIFDAIEDEFIGNFGVTAGGAVGFEIDRTDRTLGTPAHCFVLAMSEPLRSVCVPVPEEAPFLHTAITGDENAQVRSEMVLLRRAHRWCRVFNSEAF
jgi:hypothetical protein